MKDDISIDRMWVICGTSGCRHLRGCVVADGPKECDVDCGKSTSNGKKNYFNCTFTVDVILQEGIEGVIFDHNDPTCKHCPEDIDLMNIPEEERGPVAFLSS